MADKPSNSFETKERADSFHDKLWWSVTYKFVSDFGVDFFSTFSRKSPLKLSDPERFCSLESWSKVLRRTTEKSVNKPALNFWLTIEPLKAPFRFKSINGISICLWWRRRTLEAEKKMDNTICIWIAELFNQRWGEDEEETIRRWNFCHLNYYPHSRHSKFELLGALLVSTSLPNNSIAIWISSTCMDLPFCSTISTRLLEVPSVAVLIQLDQYTVQCMQALEGESGIRSCCYIVEFNKLQFHGGLIKF